MKLKIILNEFIGPNPDTFYGQRGAITFVYANDQGLIYDSGSRTHYELIFDNMENFGLNGDSYTSLDNAVAAVEKFRDTQLEDTFLTGRIGEINNNIYIAFWNRNIQLIQNEIKDCIEELINMQAIDSSTILSFPTAELTTVKNVLENKPIVPLFQNTSDVDEIRKLHLMQPQLKRAAMKRLGLASGGAKSKWQDQAEQVKLVSPGQKWWAPTSESAIK
jgi:hypothetical protein